VSARQQHVAWGRDELLPRVLELLDIASSVHQAAESLGHESDGAKRILDLERRAERELRGIELVGDQDTTEAAQSLMRHFSTVALLTNAIEVDPRKLIDPDADLDDTAERYTIACDEVEIYASALRVAALRQIGQQSIES
jgi:hypothetical protein